VPGAAVSSAVAMPIHVEHRVWGAITAVTTRPGEPLASGTDERLARLGELVALAIMSAHNRAQLATLAATDHLTGLPNRRTFTEGLAVEIERARRHGRDVSLVVMDIDHFKRINDTHGHPTGDRVLIGVAARLFADVRDTEMVARVGGEEFAWILPETDAARAGIAAGRAIRLVGHDPFPDVGRVTMSAGVGDLRRGGRVADLLESADLALYSAKADGRDRVAAPPPEGR
jgi:diguanylate cyclase (GGDEF)-like protein